MKTSCPLKNCEKKLTVGEVSVNTSEYIHAIKIFGLLTCRSIVDYHDVYLTTGVLLLASVFEAFRTGCEEDYGVGCAHYYTARNLSGGVFLKVCKADVRLLTERDHQGLVESMIRAGMSSV